MTGDIVWAHGRAWSKSTVGTWSGYFPGKYEHADDGWGFESFDVLERAYDFRWLVRDGEICFLSQRLLDEIIAEFDEGFDFVDLLEDVGKE